MFNAVDSAAPFMRQGFRMLARATIYAPHGEDAPAAASVRASVTGKGVSALFAAAEQRDVMGTVDVEEFRTAFGASATPRKYDRLATLGGVYTVQEWRGSPHDAEPVFFRLLLRGGQQ